MFKKLALVACATFALAVSTASAQVPEGSFGMSAGFSGGGTMAQLLYTPSSNFQIDLGIGYMMTSFKVPAGGTAPEAHSALSFMIGGKYFMNANAVSPYLGLGVGFATGPKTTENGITSEPSAITITPAFGAQAMIAKNVALFGQIGLNVHMLTVKDTPTGGSAVESGETHMTLGGSAVGVSFYF